MAYAGLGPNNEPTINTTLGVTVEKVDEGHSSDIEGLGESTVPFYVHAEYENHGDGAIAPSVVSGRFTIVGSDGEEYDAEGVISIVGEFDVGRDARAGAGGRGLHGRHAEGGRLARGGAARSGGRVAPHSHVPAA